MKLSSISLLIFLLIMPFFSFGLCYWYTNEIRQISEDYPRTSYIKSIEKSEDINKLKEQFLNTITSDIDSEKRTIEMYQEFTDMLLTFAIVNVILLFLFYRSLIKKVSNNAN